MPKLEWQLGDADERGVAYLSLPLSNEEARSLLRGLPPSVLPKANITKAGRMEDLLPLGFPGLYALSPRAVTTVQHLGGVIPVGLDIEGGPEGYAVLTVSGRCGVVDYRQARELRRSEKFVRLQGLHVGEVGDGVQVAIPENRDAVLCTALAADQIRQLDNVRLTPIDEVVLDLPIGRLTS